MSSEYGPEHEAFKQWFVKNVIEPHSQSSGAWLKWDSVCKSWRGHDGAWSVTNHANETWQAWQASAKRFEKTKLAEDHLAFLRTLPRQVMVNWVKDAASEEIGIHASTFALGMEPRFSKTTPLQMFDLCAAVLREHVASTPTKP